MLDESTVAEVQAKLEEQIRDLARLWEQTRQRGGRWPGGDANLFARIVQRNTLAWVMTDSMGSDSEDFAIPMQADSLPESLVDATIFMEARPTGEIRFKVTQKGQSMRIEWFIEGVSGLVDYVLWAWKWGAEYKPGGDLKRKRGRQCIELHSVRGCGGEYRSRLYIPLPFGCPFREFSAGTHSLTQHGLDGLPLQVWHSLRHIEEPLFFVERCGGNAGKFCMTYEEWENYFVFSRRNTQDVMDLAIVVTEHDRSYQEK